MRRNRRSNIKKERIIMIASSAFVLAALTMTGIYIREKSFKSENDGYTIDFSALENNVDNKYLEIVQNGQEGDADDPADLQANLEDDLDYAPVEEVGSSLVKIPGLTDMEQVGDGGLSGKKRETDESAGSEDVDSSGNAMNEDSSESAEGEEDLSAASLESMEVDKSLYFSEDQGLVKPVSGEVLIPYSMDSSVYFTTLDQYKYNPAVIISAAEGEAVSVCAEGKVISVFDNGEIGKAVTLDLGNGYQVTYGQLKDIQVSQGGYVNRGDILGYVAAPTKYYSVEGANIYFQLKKDNSPIDPEKLFQ